MSSIDIIKQFSILSIKYELEPIVLIQSNYKGYLYRRNNLPNSIKIIKVILDKISISTNNSFDDGRTNSCLDEANIITILQNNTFLQNRLYIPPIRHWFDIAVKDYKYNWLPINIKSTTTNTSDNSGNITMCVYSLTNANIKLEKQYYGSNISKIFIENLKNNNLNKKFKKDYYFLVINKTKNNIIINSLQGLTHLTSNLNNLPFQIKWCNNDKFVYNNINEILNKVLNSIIKPQPSWKETFLNEIRSLKQTIA